MKTTSILSLAMAAVSGVDAYFSGFNLASQLASGACRTENDWELAFQRIQTLPGEFKNARLYASSDCDALANAVPAAIKTGTGILVGIWTEDADHYNAEKQALLNAISQYGSSWIIAVSVGSEDLYRKDTDAQTLANQVYDVRGMINSVGVHVPVGHVDTWTAWVDEANTAVIEAVDFLGNDLYPYWQGIGTDNGAANNAYWAAVNNVVAVAQGKDVWTTETGQPVSGDADGDNTPSVESLQTYWWQVTCTSVKQMNYFFYDLDDFAASPSFRVLDYNYNPLIDMTCS